MDFFAKMLGDNKLFADDQEEVSRYLPPAPPPYRLRLPSVCSWASLLLASAPVLLREPLIAITSVSS